MDFGIHGGGVLESVPYGYQGTNVLFTVLVTFL